MAVFSQSELEAIARALGNTSEGLRGSEIGHLLAVAKMKDTDSAATKWVRIFNAFVASQNSRQDRGAILKFIRQSMKPERYLKEPERFEPLRQNVNQALLFTGHIVGDDGVLGRADAVKTLPEAQRRARELKADLVIRGVHPDVLQFCKEELLVDNYFHAVLEAVKSIADKIRKITGMDLDGNDLVDRAFSGNSPQLAINDLSTQSQQSEQRGFANLIRGTFGMFRNPTAHEARINWEITKEDAEDLLTLVSLIHRRLDGSHMPPRV